MSKGSVKKWKKYQKQHGLWVEKPTVKKKDRSMPTLGGGVRKKRTKPDKSRTDAQQPEAASEVNDPAQQAQDLVKKAVDKIGESVKELRDGNALPV